MADEIEKVIMSNENRGRGMKEGWKYVKLGDCCDVINGLWKGKKEPFIHVGVIRNANFTKDFTLNFSNVEYLDVEERQFSKRKLQKGDLIVEKSGGSEKWPVGRAVLFPQKEGNFSFSNFTSVLRIKDISLLMSEYLYKYLFFIYMRGDTRAMQRAATGIHNIEFDKYLAIQIPLPPLSEQQSIVAHLDTSFAEIDALKAKAAEEVANAKAMFDAALREEMTPKEDFPSDKLVNVFNFIDYRGATPTKLSSGIPLVTAKNVKKGYIDYTIKDYISETEYSQRQSRGISHKGDILFTTEAPLGNVALADLEVFSAGQRLITFQQYDSPKYVVENKYYMYYFLSYGFQTTLNKLATGATAQGIKAKILKEVIIPVPPISTQQRIVAKLDTLRSHLTELEQKYNHIAANCDALKQAILRETFE